jgi:hypothetical protein
MKKPELISNKDKKLQIITKREEKKCTYWANNSLGKTK